MTSSNPGRGKAHDDDAGATSLRETATAQDAGHAISITARGVPYSRCRPDSRSCDNGLGQLGRGGARTSSSPSSFRTTTARRRPAGSSGAIAGGARRRPRRRTPTLAGSPTRDIRPYSTRRGISGSAGATGGSSSASARRAPGRAGTRGRGGSCGRIAFAGTSTSSNCSGG